MSRIPDPTRRELIMTAIRDHVRLNYCMPTIRQIALRTGIASTSVVRFYLQQLAAEAALVEVKHSKGTYGRYQLPEVVEAIQKL